MLVKASGDPKHAIKASDGGYEISEYMVRLFAKASGLKSNRRRHVKKRGKIVFIQAMKNIFNDSETKS
jgi:hypothetical protein